MLCSKDYGTKSARTTILAQSDVSAQNCARLAEEVLEILPADTIWELWKVKEGLVVEKQTHTFPTNN